MNHGTWSCVSQVDAKSFANIPVVTDNSFHRERDNNPSAEKRHDDWKFSNWIPGEKKLEHFCNEHDLENQLDTDTVDENWCFKNVLLGAVVERKSSGDYTGWSSVVIAVIRMEERQLRSSSFRHNHQEIKLSSNKLPKDVIRKMENGKFNCRGSRRARIRIRKQRTS
tara:strand:+ start:1386 stop:1886 length:501 start_codon:yes stop_codon:yes gene_type:complete